MCLVFLLYIIQRLLQLSRLSLRQFFLPVRWIFQIWNKKLIICACTVSLAKPWMVVKAVCFLRCAEIFYLLPFPRSCGWIVLYVWIRRVRLAFWRLDHMQRFLWEQRDLAAEDSLCHSGRKGCSAYHVSAHPKTHHFPSPLQQTGLLSQVHLYVDIRNIWSLTIPPVQTKCNQKCKHKICGLLPISLWFI